MDLFNWRENYHQKKTLLNFNPPPAFGFPSVEGEWFSSFWYRANIAPRSGSLKNKIHLRVMGILLEGFYPHEKTG
jgi:hypothetical protein